MNDFMNESVDLKKLFLCFQRKMLLIIAVTVIGGLLCGAIYLIVRETTMPTKYQSLSKFYLEYTDPVTEALQHYNGYTWNDLLHADPILDHVVVILRDYRAAESYPELPNEILKEQLRDDALVGEILSDARLLTVTYTTDSPKTTAMYQKAMEAGLLNYAAAAREIDSMKIIRSTEPKLLIWDNHLHRAVIGGSILFLILALFAWWFYYLLDDSLYTIADAEKRYPFPVAGILMAGESVTAESLYFAETKENLAHMLCDKPNPIYLSVEGFPYPEGNRLRNADGIILEVPYGRRNGKLVDRCVSFMKNQNVEIIGLLITEADTRFLKQYYRGVKI